MLRDKGLDFVKEVIFMDDKMIKNEEFSATPLDLSRRTYAELYGRVTNLVSR